MSVIFSLLFHFGLFFVILPFFLIYLPLKAGKILLSAERKTPSQIIRIGITAAFISLILDVLLIFGFKWFVMLLQFLTNYDSGTGTAVSVVITSIFTAVYNVLFIILALYKQINSQMFQNKTKTEEKNKYESQKV